MKNSALITWIVWTVVFVIIILPVSSLFSWKVNHSPKAIADVSAQRIEKTKKNSDVLVATLDFDRPNTNGNSVHCHVDRYVLEFQSRTTNLRQIELAVSPESCGQFWRLPLPLPMTLFQWILFYLGGGGLTQLLIVFTRRRFSCSEVHA